MDDDAAEDGDENGDGGDKSKKNKGPKRSKTEHLKIDATFNIHPDNIPDDNTREQLWQIYRNLKAYKLEPTAIQAEDIKSRFKTMCGAKTAYLTLNLALQRMGNNQHGLLRVQGKPYLPLHNNLSERDIRDYVKKRKISGSTRSEAGRRCRDTLLRASKLS